MNKNKIDLTFSVSGMPPKKFREWDASCRENNSDIRWVKIWEDHKANQLLATINTIQTQITMLLQMIDSLEQKLESKQVEEPKKVTLG